MKKGIAYFLCAALTMTSFIHVYAADSNDAGLEKAINSAKAIIEVPEEFSEFDYSIGSGYGDKTWRLKWSTPKESKKDGRINVTIDDTGYILNYNKYSQKDSYLETGKLPKFSRQSAEQAAKDFIDKIQPGLSAKLEAEKNNEHYIGSNYYYFNFHYIQDSVPYYGLNYSVSVDGNTCEINSYNGTKSDGLVFPGKNGVMRISDIQKILTEAGGLELRYMRSYNYETEESYTFPAYVLTEKGNGMYDAFTGAAVENNDGGFPRYYMYDTKMAELTSSSMGSGSMDSDSLTEKELDAVKEIANVMTNEEAEKLIRAIPDLGLDDTYKVNYFRLNKDNRNKDQYIWRLSFDKENDKSQTKEDYVRNYVSASINAVTGEITEIYTDYHSDADSKIDYATAKSTADAIAKKFATDKVSQTQFFEGQSSKKDMDAKDLKISEYSFKYRRYVNGIPCDSDGIQVTVNAKTGKVSNYSLNWYNGDYAAIDKAISVEEAYKSLFDKIGMKLYYVGIHPKDTENAKIISGVIPKPEIKLVYSVDNTKPARIDSKTGELLNNDGKPYVDKSTKPYTDISGHFSEQAVKVLQEYGVGFDSEQFLPDQSITQAEFLELVLKTSDSYFSQYISNEKKQDYIYEQLLNRGIIKEDEVAPESLVTREDSVKFIIRYLNLQKVADIKDIFICDFADIDEISSDLIGYVAIAKGMNLISGFDGYFCPKNTLTRGEAAILLYNSLR